MKPIRNLFKKLSLASLKGNKEAIRVLSVGNIIQNISNRLKAKILLTALAILGIAICSSMAYAEVVSFEMPITTNPSDQTKPDIYGDKIVWQDRRNGNYDIYLYDLTSNEELAITTGINREFTPAIFQNKVVWSSDTGGREPYSIVLYDLVTHYAKRISGPYNDVAPDISKNMVVWQRYYGDVYVYDLNNGAETCITPPQWGAEERGPKISGDKIVWFNMRWINYTVIVDVRLYDLATGAVKVLIAPDTDQGWSPAIYRDKVVWSGRSIDTGKYNIYLYDIRKDEIKIISNPVKSNQANRPSIWKNRIVWSDNPSGNYDIFMYNIAMGREIQLTTESHDQINPRIYGNKVVWEDNRNGNWDIYMAELSEDSTGY